MTTPIVSNPNPHVKLTPAQQRALEILSHDNQTVLWDEIVVEWRISRDNMITSERLNSRVVKALIKRNWISKVADDEYRITAAGRKALEAK